MRQKYLMILASCLLLPHFFKCSFDTRNLRHGTLWIFAHSVVICTWISSLIQLTPSVLQCWQRLLTLLILVQNLQETSCLPCSWQKSLENSSDPLSSERIHDEFHSLVWPLVISTIHSTKPEASEIQTSSTNLSPWMAIDSLPGWVGRQPRDGFLGWNQKLMWGVWSVESLSNGLHLEADVKSCNTCGWSFLLRYLKKM